MTPVSTLEPGPELDRAVAEAIGMKVIGSCARRSTGLKEYTDNTGHKYWDEDFKAFQPSTDANDALWAAEKAGLTADHYAFTKDDGRWRVMPMDELVGRIRHADGTETDDELDGCGVWYRPIATGFSLQEAICLAILTLKERTP